MRGRAAAEHELRGGDISAQLYANLGNQLSGIISNYARERQEAPIRAMQAEGAQLELDAKRADVAAKERLPRQDAAFMALLEQQPNPDPREVMSIYGPQRGMQIAQGIAAFHAKPDPKDLAATGQVLRDRMMGLHALAPELRASMYPSVRAKSIADGLITDQDAPEQYDEAWWTQAVNYGQQPQKPGTRAVSGTKDGQAGTLIVEDTPGQFVPAAPEKPTNPTEASLAAAAAAGDQNAAEALRILRAQNTGGGREPSRPSVWVTKDGDSRYVTPEAAGELSLQGWKAGNTREQGRPVTSGDAGRVADFDTSLDDVTVLRDAVSGNKATGTAAYIGTKVPNWLTEFTGWGTDAKSKNAVIARVKQVIGKTLEGGVLRKEDEEKYKDILPTIGDVEDVVMTKLAGLEKAVSLRRQRFLESLSSASFDTSNFPAEYQPKGPQAPDPNTQTPNLSGLREGFEREITAGPFKGQVWTKVNGQAVKVR